VNIDFIVHNINKAHAGILDNDWDHDGRPNFVIRLPQHKAMKPKYFKSIKNLMKHVTNPEYEKNLDKYPGICFGVSATKQVNDDTGDLTGYNVKLHFDDSLGVMGET
jgi:hypothetical protein